MTQNKQVDFQKSFTHVEMWNPWSSATQLVMCTTTKSGQAGKYLGPI